LKQNKIETKRLIIRTFLPKDLPVIHRIFDQTFGDGSKINDQPALDDRRSWLSWSILNQEWFPKLNQAPYGDRAITLKATEELIGSTGFTAHLDCYEQIPELASKSSIGEFATPEVGLFWMVDPNHQGRGYATEAARGMIDHAFKVLRLRRIIATTLNTNKASQGVMRKVGMTITRNPLADPPWLQIVGYMNNPEANGR